MKPLKEQLLDAKYIVDRLRNERAKARALYFDASKKLELANEFKDCVLNVKDSQNPIQQHLDSILAADQKLKSTEKEFEAAIDTFERIEKEIKQQEERKNAYQPKQVVSNIDDNNFWKTTLF